MTARPLPRLHAVTDARILARPDLRERAATLARAAAVALHCRHAPTARRAVDLTAMFLAAARATEARVLVNDRADIARATGAHGVHLPADGLAAGDARRITGPQALLGRSAHSQAEVARAADEGCDYVFLGPVWATPSHPGRAPLGLGALEAAARRGIPVIAIGGVTPERAARCRAAGAWGAAALTALWDAADPGSAADRFLLSLG